MAGVSMRWAARGSGSAPQEMRRSWSPPKPDWWVVAAAHAEAGSAGPVSVWTEGSSSRKTGPVSSTEAAGGAAPAGVGRVSPSDGAGRLVPGTQAAPFQYRTYPGMDGSG
ncbi:hypothetical protein [Streptomyces sp. NPDC046939]|uniref:hypothetical protein n=1 Tax=Streptomyces sp. NPDC046939 TaxID=3155376 RepID=UPI0033F44F4B